MVIRNITEMQYLIYFVVRSYYEYQGPVMNEH